MKIHPLIIDRWSPVAFDHRIPGEAILNCLFSAAMWAPSSRNAQPWRFIYVTKSDPGYGAFFALLDEGNKVWAHTAPVLALSIAEIISSYKNRHNYFAVYDTGMAVGNLLLQATHLGLFVHQMGGYDMEKARQVLNIPDRFEPIAMMAIGYKGDPAQLDESEASRETTERKRHRTEDHVYKGSWGVH